MYISNFEKKRSIKTLFHMKNLAILTFMSFLLAISCTKKTVEPKPSILGIWKGKFGVGAKTAPNQDVIFDIKEGGKILVYNGSDIPSATVKGSGTYTTTKEGLVLNATYTYPNNPLTYTVEVITTADFKELKGTWNFNSTFGGNIKFIKL
jgi:hypothetical protein